MKRLFLVFLMMVVLSGTASASISVGGYTFDDNAFVDTLISSSGSFNTSGGSLSDVLTDKDEATYAFSWSSGAYVNLGFTDNLLVNGSGADLVLFETGVPDSFSVTINSITNNYLTSYTGYSAGGYDLNAVAINLEDFGVASNAGLSSILIGMDIVGSGTVPSLSLAGALNSSSSAVPIPAAVWLFGSGLVGLLGLRRKVA
ncbi:MAG: hypothetical protein A4E72_02052 [Syntrophus sp. PtaU1.Bin208]|nr:MAG: hypothetical protein A4E72_02052 [Syntrophus sp. PtaU1.Bin208]